jgi:peptidoglycan/LPS O-acetylase OafA/YrhL
VTQILDGASSSPAPALSPESAPKTQFRADIQGLRALAVLMVIVNHLTEWPAGGFVGVDVFFVISGFLITGLLLREHDRTGRISFTGFYVRRAKRILPAGLLVIAVTVCLSPLVFFSSRANSILIDGLWAAGFAANWRFADVGTNYFVVDGPVSPLQHYWSLAVEEQFYFVWPWLMLAIFLLGGGLMRHWSTRASRIVAGLAMGAITAISLWWAIEQSVDAPTDAYFSAFSRAWELGVGALLAVGSAVLLRIPHSLRPLLAWTGLGAIATSMFVISESSQIPAPAMILPVAGSALVIAAGTGGQQRFLWPLTGRTSTYIGDISYSLYVWHFPAIIFLAALLPDISDARRYVVTLLVIGAVSALSFRFVEEPIRHWESKRSKARRGRRTPLVERDPRPASAVAFPALLAVVLALVLLALQTPKTEPSLASLGVDTSSLPSASSSEDVKLTPVERQQVAIAQALTLSNWPEDLDPSLDELADAKAPEWTEDACVIIDEGNVDRCVYGPAQATKDVAVLGDSIATSWLPAIRGALEPLGWRIHPLTRSECSPEVTEVLLTSGDPYPECAEHRDWALGEVESLQPDLIIASGSMDNIQRLASRNTGDAAIAEVEQGWVDLEQRLGDLSSRLVVLGAPPAGKNLQKCATKTSKPVDCISGVASTWADYRDAAQASGLPYIDPVDWFCVSGRCPGVVSSTPVRADTSHLTGAYSAALAPLLTYSLKEQKFLIDR